jgi:hypothetical protein
MGTRERPSSPTKNKQNSDIEPSEEHSVGSFSRHTMASNDFRLAVVLVKLESPRRDPTSRQPVFLPYVV